MIKLDSYHIYDKYSLNAILCIFNPGAKLLPLYAKQMLLFY